MWCVLVCTCRGAGHGVHHVGEGPAGVVHQVKVVLHLQQHNQGRHHLTKHHNRVSRGHILYYRLQILVPDPLKRAETPALQFARLIFNSNNILSRDPNEQLCKVSAS